MNICDWNEIAPDFKDGSILIGNGISQNISKKYQYCSLYDTACTTEAEGGLMCEDIELFNALKTENGLPNFEQVLAHLQTAESVCEALGIEHSQMKKRYESIQRALSAAVKSVHVSYSEIDKNDRREAIANAMTFYRNIFTTNYDLILYWAMAKVDFKGFRDYFFSDGHTHRAFFDPYRGHEGRPVAFLHGGLHLYALDDGLTVKRVRGQGKSLLDSYPNSPVKGGRPLIVTEGTSERKLNTISGNRYLSFVYNLFAEDTNPLVIFGHSLAENDQHIVDAINANQDPNRHVSIAVQRPPKKSVELIIEEYRDRINANNCRIRPFWADTHPLGSPKLHIPDEEESS